MSEHDKEDQEFLADLHQAVAEITAYYEELGGESPRAAAVLAVSSLHDELEKLVRAKFPKASPETWKRIAGPGFTPLGSFKALNCVANAFDFYGPKTMAMLERISSVRNKFAHETTVRQFDHPLIVEQFKKLADNPIMPFTWRAQTHAAEIRATFLELVLATEKALLEIRSQYLFPPDQPPAQLP